MKNICPECGSKLEKRTSFKGVNLYKSKRKTLVCNCGYSTIVETYRERLISEGKLDNE